MKKMKKNWVRYVLQFGVIALIVVFILKVFAGGKPADPEAYCPFGGLEAFMTYLNSETLACTMSGLQIMMGIALAVGVILFSKLFCGYLCPLGTITEWMGVLRKKWKINLTVKSGSVTDKALRAVKYILLFWIFYMTVTSSELFCKNFDPYYAMATGFQGEITVWMTVISILLLFAGSLLINMFWCKYVCPLGALSHIFKFTLTFAGLVVLSLVSGYFGLPMHWIWMLAAACVISYVYEIVYYKSKVFPLLRVTKDEEKCNHCGLCSKRCPYRIDIADVKVVKHVDCTLCGECIASCNQGALTVSHRKAFRWLPAAAVVVLFFIGLWLGNHWELPTINEYWGDPAKQELMQTYERDGMRTVKCYGSSMAFAAKMKQVPGVYGVTTYVKRFGVEVRYDPNETTAEKIEKAMFTPTRRKLLDVPASVPELKIVTIGVDKLFDRMDITYLGNMIRENEGYYGLESEYACPVKIRLYMDANKPVDEDELDHIIGAREYDMPVHGGGVRRIKCDFKLVYVEDQVDSISRLDFLKLMFPVASFKFKGNIGKQPADVETAVYEVAYPGLDKPIVQRQLPYLSSFLSSDEAILAFETQMKGDMPVIRITYVKGGLTDEKIWQLLQSPKWTVHYKDGSVKEMSAMLSFENPGATVE